MSSRSVRIRKPTCFKCRVISCRYLWARVTIIRMHLRLDKKLKLLFFLMNKAEHFRIYMRFSACSICSTGWVDRNTLAVSFQNRQFHLISFKSQTKEVSLLILHKILNIFEKDDYNYCLLESHNILLYSLDSLSVKIHTKPMDIQVRVSDDASARWL